MVLATIVPEANFPKSALADHWPGLDCTWNIPFDLGCWQLSEQNYSLQIDCTHLNVFHLFPSTRRRLI